MAALVAFVSACAADQMLAPDVTSSFDVGLGRHVIEVGSLEREYILHVPQRRPMTQSGTLLPYPLIIVLHGSSGTADDIRGTTNMDSIAEANRTVVVYPNGVRGSGGLFPSDWNAGTCCGAAARENIDDLGFIRATIDQVASKLPIDSRRIYVAGFSDGGRMAYYLACKMSDRIAAIGVVSGSLRDDNCVPSRSVAVIALHGTDDPIVPYDEEADSPPPEPVSGMGAELPPAVQFWIAANGCSGGTEDSFTSRVIRTTFTTCTGSDIAFYALEGGQHTWPVLVDSTSVNADESISATALIARFFRRHSIK